MSHSGINEKLEKDKSDDEDDEQHGFNKKRTRKESPVSIQTMRKAAVVRLQRKDHTHRQRKNDPITRTSQTKISIGMSWN